METLRATAQAAHPLECCGLVTGRPGLIEAVVPAMNVSPHPESSFEIDPAMLLRTHREARAAGQRVIGHYHSHPNGEPTPSRRDAARAVEDGQLWLIITGGAVQAFRAVSSATGNAVHGRFVPVTLVTA